jgi:hypothetical protein
MPFDQLRRREFITPLGGAAAVEKPSGRGAYGASLLFCEELLAPSLEGPFLWEALAVTAFAPDIGRSRWRLLGRQRSASGTVQRPI